MAGRQRASSIEWLHSIRLRIMLGFLLVLLLLAAVAGVVWRAGGQVSVAFGNDAMSEDLAAHVVEVQSRMAEARLRVAEFLRTGGADEGNALTAAVTELANASASASGHLASVSQPLDAVRVAVVATRDAIEQRRDAAARLTASSVALTTAATSLAEGAARSGQREFAEPATSLLAAIARATGAASRFAVTGTAAEADSAKAEATRARELLNALVAAASGSARMQRVGGAAGDALNEFELGIPTVEAALQARQQRLAELTSAADKAAAVLTDAAHSIANERAANRAVTLSAQGSLRATVVWAAACAILIGCGIAVALGRSITRPVRRLAETMAALAAGQLTVDVPGVAKRDEIGVMARAVQVFKDNMADAERLRAEKAELTAQAVKERQVAMLRLADDFENSVGNIVTTVSDASTRLQGAAQSMSSAAAEAADKAGVVSTASAQASENVQMVAAATEELTASIGEINAQVAKSSRIAADAVGQAQRTDATVQSLAEAARRIGDVIGLIHEIAGQTNLLALNATIEAARAGDAGKGFAVVASEVKNLAVQTAKATDEIAAQVAAIQGTTSETVNALHAISRTIDEMSEIATAIAGAVEQQSSATQEIAANIGQAASGTQAVTGTIAGLTEASDAVGAAASEVLGDASGLSQQSNRLRAEMQQFLSHVRAA